MNYLQALRPGYCLCRMDRPLFNSPMMQMRVPSSSSVVGQPNSSPSTACLHGGSDKDLAFGLTIAGNERRGLGGNLLGPFGAQNNRF